MMVLLHNRQNIPINTVQLEKDVHIILQHLGYKNFDLGILLCDTKTIHDLNKKHRDKDKPTDILSFPFYPDLQPGQRIEVQTDDEKNIGDIIICPEYVKADLKRWDQSFEQRMRVLLIHGICHLLGYDHIKDEDYEVMKKKEKELLLLLK